MNKSISRDMSKCRASEFNDVQYAGFAYDRELVVAYGTRVDKEQANAEYAERSQTSQLVQPSVDTLSKTKNVPLRFHAS